MRSVEWRGNVVRCIRGGLPSQSTCIQSDGAETKWTLNLSMTGISSRSYKSTRKITVFGVHCDVDLVTC